MAAIQIFRGPPPPRNERWCSVCIRLYKGKFLELESTQLKVSHANSLAGTEKVIFDMKFPPGQEPPLEVAVATGMYPMPFQWLAPGQQTPVPVECCWSHVDALIIKESGVMGFPANALPHEKGAAILGQGRR